jgi:hypothetical protein
MKHEPTNADLQNELLGLELQGEFGEYAVEKSPSYYEEDEDEDEDYEEWCDEDKEEWGDDEEDEDEDWNAQCVELASASFEETKSNLEYLAFRTVSSAFISNVAPTYNKKRRARLLNLIK